MALVQTEPNPMSSAQLKLEFSSMPFGEAPKAKQVSVAVALANWLKINIMSSVIIMIIF